MIVITIIIVTLITIMIIMFVIMFLKGHQNHLNKHTIEFDDFPKNLHPLSIFFISDIHRRKISERLLEKIPQEVDLVVIGGDLTESGVPFSRVEKNIKILGNLGPTYFVFGNNDYEVGKEKLESLLVKNSVHVLNNTSTTLMTRGEERVVLIGVEDMSEKRDRLDLALQNTNSSDFKVLLSHNPDIYDKTHPKDRISLVLSGHTHGGQIRFFGLGLYQKGKLHHLRNSTLLVSNGYGTTLLPLRLGAPAEAHFIQLCMKSKKEKNFKKL